MLPALQARLDTAFPEFGFKPDALGWVATNEETTHRALGVRAERVVAHGPAPPGILIHGGDAIPWTAYLNGGQLPRGEAFVATVKELAARAGVDTTPIERPQPRDRRTDLLHDFFTLCRMELHGKAGARARDYLRAERPPRRSPRARQVLASSRPPPIRSACSRRPATRSKRSTTRAYSPTAAGPVASAEPGATSAPTSGTLWARTIHDADTAPKFLYLRGAGRSGSTAVRALRRPEACPARAARARPRRRPARRPPPPRPRPREHRSRRCSAHPARQPRRLHEARHRDGHPGPRQRPARPRRPRSRHRADQPRRRRAQRSGSSTPSELGDAKDPDAYVREHGIDAFRALLGEAECAITWRTLDPCAARHPDSRSTRTASCARTGSASGSARSRRDSRSSKKTRSGRSSERSGYAPRPSSAPSAPRFWPEPPERAAPGRVDPQEPELDHSVDL